MDIGLNLNVIRDQSYMGSFALGNQGKGTIFRRKDDRYLLYLPVKVVDDSMFPLKCNGSMPVKVSFVPNESRLIMEKWKEQDKP